MTLPSNGVLPSAAPSPEDIALAEEEGREPPHQDSLTEVAIEGAQLGIVDPAPPPEIPGEDSIMEAGDPDVDPLENEYTGDEVPGGDMPTPDQNNIDEIGRAYGISEENSSALRTAGELLDQRDARRNELDPDSPPPRIPDLKRGRESRRRPSPP
jgi:hypothetical protein